MLVLEGLVGLHRTVQFQLLLHYWWEHRLESRAQPRGATPGLRSEVAAKRSYPGLEVRGGV